MAMRRSSLGEDLLRRRFSRPSDRLSVASDSLALISDIDDDESPSQKMDHYGYGSIEGGEGDHVPPHDPKLLRKASSIVEEAALLRDELLAMLSLAAPVIVTYLLEFAPGMITIVLVGRLEGEDTKLHVDAAALAVMYFNIVGMSSGLGLLTSLDTLYASAWGANQPSKMGKYLLTGAILMAAMSCFVAIALYNTTNALLFFGQPPSVAHEAGIFAMWMLPGLPFLYAYELLRKISQAKNETMPMILSAVVSVLANTAVGYFMVNHTHWGWLGAALARTLGYMLLFPTVFIGMYCSDRQFLSQVWSGFQLKEAIKVDAVAKFLSLGIPGMIQLVVEWSAFEVVALLCGIFPDEDNAIIAIGANAIVFQISTLVFTLYLGASMAGTVRIGNALGAGDVHRAKMASFLALVLGILLSSINISFILGFRKRLPYFFTTDADLITKSIDLFLVVALFQLPDAVNAIEQGIFRAIGMQSLSAKLNVTAYYIIGIPLGYALGFPLSMGVEGLWLGITAGLLFVSTINTIILLQIDWQHLAIETRKRLSIVVLPEGD